jgi:galactose mutarotase-like enzyme
MQDLLTLTNGHAEAQISVTGAELVSFQPAGMPVLIWQGAPGRWPGHAPLLFPLISQTPDHHIEIDGQKYPMPPHGFARTAEFVVDTAGAAEALLRFEDSPETRRHYPFPFAFTAHYRLDGSDLHLTLSVENRGTTDMPCDVGIHPGFNWPLEPWQSKNDYNVIFAAEETAPIRRGVDDPVMLLPEPQPSPVEGRILRPRDSLFEGALPIVFDRLQSRSLTFAREGGAGIRLDFPDSPNLGLWMQPGANFLALEPWHGYPAQVDFAGPLAQKPGIAHVGAGQTRSWRFAMAPFSA